MAHSVPSLLRQTLINAAKQRQPIRTEIPGQQHNRRSHDQHQGFELYSCDMAIWEPTGEAKEPGPRPARLRWHLVTVRLHALRWEASISKAGIRIGSVSFGAGAD
jgi:hypothetical protein